MPEEYGALKHKVPKEKGETPNAPQAFKDFSDSILKPATGAAKQLAIVQADGTIVYKTIGGDATLAENGTLTIAENAVGASEIAANAVGPSEIAASAVEESELADKAVTSRKAKLTAGVIYGTGGLAATSGVYSDVSGLVLEITPAVESKLFVLATFSVKTGATTNVEGTLKLDSNEEEVQRAILYSEVGTASIQATIAQSYAFTLSAAKHTIKGRIRDGSSGNGEISPAQCSLLYFLVAV